MTISILSFGLPDTRTYHRRGYTLVSPAETEGGMRYLARVQLTQYKPLKRKRETPETDHYFLDEIHHHDRPAGWRVFLWLKTSSPPTDDEPGLYQTDVDAAGVVRSCTCKGASCKRQDVEPTDDYPFTVVGPCKHCDCLRAVLAMLSGEELPELY